MQVCKDLLFSKEMFFELLNNRLSEADIELLKQDIRPYLNDPKEMEIWSNDYFLQFAKMIKFL